MLANEQKIDDCRLSAGPGGIRNAGPPSAALTWPNCAVIWSR